MSWSSPPSAWPVLTCLLLLSAPHPSSCNSQRGSEPPFLLCCSQEEPLPCVHWREGHESGRSGRGRGCRSIAWGSPPPACPGGGV